MKFRDFQITFQPTPEDDRNDMRMASLGVFAMFEPLRLWIRAQKIDAPFVKLLIQLERSTLPSGSTWCAGHANGICFVGVSVDFSRLGVDCSTVEWMAKMVQASLAAVRHKIGWGCLALDAHVAELTAKPWPLDHHFAPYDRIDRKTGVTVATWAEFEPGRTELVVKQSRQEKFLREDIVKTAEGQLYMEDDFPISRAAIRSGRYDLLTKTGEVLVSIPLEVGR